MHTLELPNANDTIHNDILKYCKAENRVVITKDNDFLESFLINNNPQKLIIVRTGNIMNAELHELFNINFEYLYNSISENNLIEINKTEIIIHK